MWDGNVPLHEWRYEGIFPPQASINKDGDVEEEKEPVENLTTWVYADGSFVPSAKIEAEKKYSIVADYLGTPTHSYDEGGQLVWERELDCYGAVRKEKGEKGLIPQLYQGQYVDEETGLAYNRFRYYDNESGNYVSQDPIGLAGDNPTMYGYVKDTTGWVDFFGLSCTPKGKKIRRTVYRAEQPDRFSTTWTAHKWNVASNHRYTKPGVGGVYGANSKKTALAEVNHYGVDMSTRQIISKKVALNNVLDLTDPRVRKQLGIELDEITGNSYDKTHELGDWAKANGYNGILAPSARNPTGSNLIGFDGL